MLLIILLFTLIIMLLLLSMDTICFRFSVHQSICPSIHPSVYPSIWLTAHFPSVWSTDSPSSFPPQRFWDISWRTTVWKEWPDVAWPPSELIRFWSWSVDLPNLGVILIWWNRFNLGFPGNLWWDHGGNCLISLMNFDSHQKVLDFSHSLPNRSNVVVGTIT